MIEMSFLEVRAGTGGDEAAIFAGELVRMYLRHVESKGWKHTFVSSSEGTVGGVKEAVINLSGEGVYGWLKFESGVHRVQRVPANRNPRKSPYFSCNCRCSARS